MVATEAAVIRRLRHYEGRVPAARPILLPVDEYGDEAIYWFLYAMILDGDTGAIEYVPLTSSIPIIWMQ